LIASVVNRSADASATDWMVMEWVMQILKLSVRFSASPCTDFAPSAFCLQSGYRQKFVLHAKNPPTTLM
jgi:hypothetical protein